MEPKLFFSLVITDLLPLQLEINILTLLVQALLLALERQVHAHLAELGQEIALAEFLALEIAEQH
jgi:hypothetical protein